MLDTKKIFDPDKFVEQTLDVKEVKMEIKHAFLKQTPEICDMVRHAIDEKHTLQLARLLHKLKSSVGLFCRREFADELNYLEKHAEIEFKNKRFRERLERMLEDLKIMVREVAEFPVE